MNDSSANKKSSLPAQNTPKKRKKVSLSYLENAGLYYLERFSASEGQFRRVMARKIDKSCRDHPEQSKEDCMGMLESVIVKFRELGYLNDSVYAKSLLYTLQQKGFSRTRILLTLKSKGLSSVTTEPLGESMPDSHDRYAAIRFMQRKRLGPFSSRPRDNAAQRDLASMARAGFSYDVAQAALSLSVAEAEQELAEWSYTTD